MELTIPRYSLKELIHFTALSPVSSSHFCSNWMEKGWNSLISCDMTMFLVGLEVSEWKCEWRKEEGK